MLVITGMLGWERRSGLVVGGIYQELSFGIGELVRPVGHLREDMECVNLEWKAEKDWRCTLENCETS